jgi:hypothetical protein
LRWVVTGAETYFFSALVHTATLFSLGSYSVLNRNLPRAKNVEELRQSLLYNNTLEVWMALCTERGREWRNINAYSKFLTHLANVGVKLDLSVVCPPIKGFSEKPPKAFNIKLDTETIRKIRTFDSGTEKDTPSATS